MLADGAPDDRGARRAAAIAAENGHLAVLKKILAAGGEVDWVSVLSRERVRSQTMSCTMMMTGRVMTVRRARYEENGIIGILHIN